MFQVPGRLGVLVTLHLISANIYNSVEGPSNRGFSFIEIWMVGTQIPILLAVFEYGIILMLKRKVDAATISKANLIKVSGSDSNMAPHKVDKPKDKKYKSVQFLDKCSFIGSLTFIVLFNLVYWTLAKNV